MCLADTEEEEHDELRNTIYYLLPQRKKNKFKASGVKAVVPLILMVHVIPGFYTKTKYSSYA
jgi:hypothetical protein